MICLWLFFLYVFFLWNVLTVNLANFINHLRYLANINHFNKCLSFLLRSKFYEFYADDIALYTRQKKINKNNLYSFEKVSTQWTVRRVWRNENDLRGAICNTRAYRASVLLKLNFIGMNYSRSTARLSNTHANENKRKRWYTLIQTNAMSSKLTHVSVEVSIVQPIH